MERITADAETLMRQASITSSEYFQQAIIQIDNAFGKGYAKSNPQLIGDFMKVSASDFFVASLTSGLQDLANAVENKEYSHLTFLLKLSFSHCKVTANNSSFHLTE